MTETMTEPAPPPFTSPRLERPADSRYRGVCTAIARTTGTDVLLWRVLAVVLTFFSGLGAVLYLVGLAVIPREGEEHSLAYRLFHGPDRHLVRDELLILLVLAVAAALLFSDGRAVLAVVVIAVLALTVRHRTAATPREVTPPAPPAPPSSQNVSEPEPSEVLTAPESVAVTPPPPPPVVPRPPRERSVLSAITVSAATLVAGVLVLIGAAGAAHITAPVVVAATLAVVGLGLVVGAWWGRPRGLTALAVLLALALGVTAAVQPVLDSGAGRRQWTATSSSTYKLGAGYATLTLSPEQQQVTTSQVKATVDLGRLEIVVPAGLRVVIDAHVQTGEIAWWQSDALRNGRDISHTFVLGPEGAPQVHVDANVYAGLLEVHRV